MWVAVEILTMGNLSAIYRNLKGPYQKVLARSYHTGPVQLDRESNLYPKPPCPLYEDL